MAFILGRRSLANLERVYPPLVSVVKTAITLTPVDFTVFEGVRTSTRQQKLFDIGATHTLNSKHLIQPDGYGHAVDLVPWLDWDGDGDSENRWDWSLGFVIAKAMQKAAQEHQVDIRWGGCWDRSLITLGDPEAAYMDYISRRKAAKLRAWGDAPHFECKTEVL
jgi:peptidoglycan L-alanyl-D-glutamate endopeptidase CwlK